MKFTITGDSAIIMKGLSELQASYDFSLAERSEINITCVQEETLNGLAISYRQGNVTITYAYPNQFFRAFSMLLQHLQQEDTPLETNEKMQFSTVGPMFDLSRNMTMKLTTLKDFIRKLAMMGHNSIMLYMEDTYEVSDEPYFGYMRGRYTEVELRELDEYAALFGIELIPCIQTLAHLEEFLKWDAAYKYKDTRGALLLESEDTYDLLDRMIHAVTKPFRSKRIHIGMDEAEEVGRGRFLNIHGYQSRFEMMSKHLTRVLEITDKYELEAMMWSDMFLKLASETGDQYDKSTNLPEYIIQQLPENVQFMYWQYNQTDYDHYDNMIGQLKRFGRTPAFAGGMWVWNTFAPNYHISLSASEKALQACKDNGIRDVFVTLWGDDGYENNVYTSLYGLQYYVEHAFSEQVDELQVKQRATFITGIDADALLLLNKLDQPPGVADGNLQQTNPSKFLLWQDPLLGVFDKHIEGLDLDEYYKDLSKQIERKQKEAHEYGKYHFDVPKKLCTVLANKASLGVNLKQAYDKKQLSELTQLVDTKIVPLLSDVCELRSAHRRQWLTMNKPFGWEVIDIRYGGLLNRLETTKDRIERFVHGELDQIEELDQERLYYSPRFEQSTGLGWGSYYYRMASPNVFFHVLPIY